MPDRDVGFAENDNRQSGPVQGVAHRRAGAAVSRPGLVPPCEKSAPLRAYVCTRAHGVRKWPYMWLAQRFPCDTVFTYGVASPIAISLPPPPLLPPPFPESALAPVFLSEAPTSSSTNPSNSLNRLVYWMLNSGTVLCCYLLVSRLIHRRQCTATTFILERLVESFGIFLLVVTSALYILQWLRRLGNYFIECQ